MMDRVKTIMHKEKPIIYCDFSGFDVFSKDQLQETVDAAQKYIAKQAPGSVLILTNVAKLHFDSEILKIFGSYTAQNKPYIKASAIIGIAGLLNIGLSAVARNALHDIHSFDTEPQALDWLVEQ